MNYYRRNRSHALAIPGTPRSIFIAGLVFMGILYFAFTFATIRLAAIEQGARESARALHSRVTGLEEQYLSLQEGLTRSRAGHVGLTDAIQRTVFASRDGSLIQTARLDVVAGISGN